jgi:hypothetical protein
LLLLSTLVLLSHLDTLVRRAGTGAGGRARTASSSSSDDETCSDDGGGGERERRRPDPDDGPAPLEKKLLRALPRCPPELARRFKASSRPHPVEFMKAATRAASSSMSEMRAKRQHAADRIGSERSGTGKRRGSSPL